MITHLKLFEEVMIAAVVLVWLGFIRWTYVDARQRIADPALARWATASALLPILGPLLYVIVRPPEYLDDVRMRALETHALEARLRQLRDQRCPHCSYQLRAGFVRCPRCAAELRQPCERCQRPLDLAWPICPFCDGDLPEAQRLIANRAAEVTVLALPRPRGDRPSAAAPFPASRPRSCEPPSCQPPTQRSSRETAA